MDNRRKTIMAIIITFMVVTIPHIAIYASSFEPALSSILGLPYALAVEASIIVCAYFTKWQTTRRWAWIGYFVFVSASGVMNVGYIEPTTFPAWIYATFPTLAIALLGFLYRQVDKLVYAKESQHKPAQISMSPLPEPAQTALEQFLCQQCEREFASVQALNAHMRFCKGHPQNGQLTEVLSDLSTN